MAHVEIGKALDISALKDDFSNLSDDFRDATETAREALVHQVETSPLASILIAAGIGFLASQLLRLSRAPRLRAVPAPRPVRRARRSPSH